MKNVSLVIMILHFGGLKRRNKLEYKGMQKEFPNLIQRNIFQKETEIQK